MRETLENLPADPGVYQMKDPSGKILYIGKAKSLKNRVRSYFQESAELSPRIALMVEKVAQIGLIVTGSEMEALVLEDNLIKREQPRYNVMLKDDKNYPYLKLTTGESFPRLMFVRRREDDKAMYFGPYVSARSVRSTLRLIHKIFPLRQSRDNLDGKDPRRPCLNYQMKHCLAPCAGLVSKEEYTELVNEVILFLKGRNTELLARMKGRMMEAADMELFEVAARYRDQIAAIEILSERQMATQTRLTDEDVIAINEEAGKAIIKIFQVRRGKIVGDRHFMFERLDKLDRPEALAAFIRQFYTGGMEVPSEVVVGEEPDGRESLEERLSVIRGTKAKIIVPERGPKRKLLDMAERNAALQLASLLNTSSARDVAMEEIRERLGLDRKPVVIEGIDISNTSGLASVGSVVCFKEGAASKPDYRKYKIKSVAGPDDYASLAEVIERKFTRIAGTGEPAPDLLLIDGGKGQLSAVMERFAAINLEPPAIVGVAKGADRENPETDEFYLPGQRRPVDFPPSSPGRSLLQQVRDEAHRFAVAYHRKVRGDEMMASKLDKVAGLGPKRKKLLLTKFGSLKRAREATVEELMETLKVTEKMAKKIREGM